MHTIDLECSQDPTDFFDGAYVCAYFEKIDTKVACERFGSGGVWHELSLPLFSSINIEQFERT